MQVNSYTPEPPLDTLVQSVWYFEGFDLLHTMERIIPNGSMQLLVNLQDDELRWSGGADFKQVNRIAGAALSGAFSRPIVIDTAQQRAITGVSFAPGGAAAFFCGSMREFKDDHVSLLELPACQSIRDELLEAYAISPEAVICTWMRFLHRRYRTDQFRHVQAARIALDQGYGVQQVADRLSMSVRKLRQDFSHVVGLPPKVYARISRIQRIACDAAQRGTGDCDWAALAVKHGYFDQAHMMHDFRSLIGTTPADYRPRSSDDWNHIVVG